MLNIALGFLLILVGAGIAWRGPLDPRYMQDWILFLLGVGAAGLGLVIALHAHLT